MRNVRRSATICLMLLTLAGCAATVPYGPGDGNATASRLSSSPSPAIKTRIDELLPDSLFPPASLGIRVVTVRTGEPMYELNPDLLFTPASSQKLLTAAAGLALLGPAHRFDTVVRVDSTDERTITITGAGDPLLTTADIDTVADMLREALPGRVPWTLAADVSAFDDTAWGKGWMWDDEPDPTAMEISPLSVNRNCIAVRVRPGQSAGDPLKVDLAPATDFVSVVNEGMSTPDSVRNPLKVTRTSSKDSQVVRVSGEMKLSDSTVTRRLSVRDPARYFLTLLAERLRSQGVAVSGLRIDAVPGRGDPIIVRSRTLDSIVTFMNTWSDNLSAECVLKTLGRRETTAGRGSSAEGVRMMRRVLQSLGVDTTTVVSADGSGVSRYNLVSVRAFTNLLTHIARDTTLFPVLWHSLPVAGRSGTLLRRMRGTPAEGVVHAKTGTMTGASSLAGYARTADGELVAFAIMMQNYPGDAGRYRAVQDSVAALLARLGRL